MEDNYEYWKAEDRKFSSSRCPSIAQRGSVDLAAQAVTESSSEGLANDVDKCSEKSGGAGEQSTTTADILPNTTRRPSLPDTANLKTA